LMVVSWRKARVLESSGESVEVVGAAACAGDAAGVCGATTDTMLVELVAVETGDGADAGATGAETRTKRG
jgi:hypothetical protein